MRSGWPSAAFLAKKPAKPAARKGAPAAARGSSRAEAAEKAKPTQRTQAARTARVPGSPALQAYEKALERVRKQEWKGARQDLLGLIESHPAEIEIGERARSWLRVCERFLAEKASEPRHIEEHYQAGILALNAGRYDQAIGHFERTLQLGKEHDAAQYGLACACALAGRRELALKHLRLAIQLNADNRIHATADSDFELLRDDPDFAELMASTQGSPTA